MGDIFGVFLKMVFDRWPTVGQYAMWMLARLYCLRNDYGADP